MTLFLPPCQRYYPWWFRPSGKMITTSYKKIPNHLRHRTKAKKMWMVSENISYDLRTSYLLIMCMHICMCMYDSENHNYAFPGALPIGIVGGDCKAGGETQGFLFAVYFLTLVVPSSSSHKHFFFSWYSSSWIQFAVFLTLAASASCLHWEHQQ